ncbi:hypothetical protein CALCODRAFT_109208 [Calocera cornea HHB12733]|uniref:Uncharacterized protein n=1 Tax=Calocera cornea HHB12733 TaxID=1353952 RepID=A0A165D2S4_9BASI|nr:hypothetical protein CALCODRAFT_109208 [Calocera cornea HHB12733]
MTHAMILLIPPLSMTRRLGAADGVARAFPTGPPAQHMPGLRMGPATLLRGQDGTRRASHNRGPMTSPDATPPSGDAPRPAVFLSSPPADTHSRSTRSLSHYIRWRIRDGTLLTKPRKPHFLELPHHNQPNPKPNPTPNQTTHHGACIGSLVSGGKGC